MRLPYSPPVLVPLSSTGSAGSSGSLEAAPGGDAEGSIGTAQGATGSGKV
jgi:hypothetical protein